jgi:hypothetical protein
MSAKDYTSAVGHGTAGVFTHLERFVNSLGASLFGDFGLGTSLFKSASESMHPSQRETNSKSGAAGA